MTHEKLNDITEIMFAVWLITVEIRLWMLLFKIKGRE